MFSTPVGNPKDKHRSFLQASSIDSQAYLLLQIKNMQCFLISQEKTEL